MPSAGDNPRTPEVQGFGEKNGVGDEVAAQETEGLGEAGGGTHPHFLVMQRHFFFLLRFSKRVKIIELYSSA